MSVKKDKHGYEFDLRRRSVFDFLYEEFDTLFETMLMLIKLLTLSVWLLRLLCEDMDRRRLRSLFAADVSVIWRAASFEAFYNVSSAPKC